MIKLENDDIINAIKTSKTMAEAAAKLNVHFSTFKRYAQKFNCYKPNQGGLGCKKKTQERIPLQEILDGLHPGFQTYKLKLKLFKAKMKNVRIAV